VYVFQDGNMHVIVDNVKEVIKMIFAGVRLFLGLGEDKTRMEEAFKVAEAFSQVLEVCVSEK
jgi:hypothetical protein